MHALPTPAFTDHVNLFWVAASVIVKMAGKEKIVPQTSMSAILTHVTTLLALTESTPSTAHAYRASLENIVKSIIVAAAHAKMMACANPSMEEKFACVNLNSVDPTVN